MARSIRGSVVAVVTALVLTGLPLAGSAGAGEGCSDTVLQTLSVDVAADRRHYEIGETVSLKVKVDRVVDLSRPDLTVPVEDALVTSVLYRKGIRFFDGAFTDEGGRAELKVKISRRAQSGWMDSFTYATKAVTPCASEEGYRALPRLIRILKG
jgi:hypothetical protein